MNLLYAAALTFIINLPFGYWRGGTRKYSWQWILAIHIPVPMVIALRFIFDLGFALYTYPVMVFCFFSGQWLGGYIYRRRKGAGEVSNQ